MKYYCDKGLCVQYYNDQFLIFFASLLWNEYFDILDTWTPVLESMRAREPGLQAPSNLTGSKIKNTHIFLPFINSFSETWNPIFGRAPDMVVVLVLNGKPSNQVIKNFSKNTQP